MKRWLSILTLLALMGFGAAWAYQSWPDARVVKVQELQSRLRTSGGMPEEERRALFDELRSEMDQLPEGTRDELREAQRDEFEDRMLTRMKVTLAMEGAEQRAALDAQIDEFEQRRKEWEARRKAREQQGEAGGAQKSDDKGGSRGGTSAENRDARRKARLDRSSPEQRAVRAEYRKLMEQRRKERGMTPMPMRG